MGPTPAGSAHARRVGSSDRSRRRGRWRAAHPAPRLRLASRRGPAHEQAAPRRRQARRRGDASRGARSRLASRPSSCGPSWSPSSASGGDEVVKIEERVLAKEEEIDKKLDRARPARPGVADREVHLQRAAGGAEGARDARAAGARAHRAADDRRGAQADPRAVRGRGPARAGRPRAPDRGGGGVGGEAARRNLVADALQRVAASAHGRDDGHRSSSFPPTT